MTQESDSWESIRHFLYLLICMCIVKGIIQPAIKEHNSRQAEKERVEAYQSFLSDYALYLLTMAEVDADSTCFNGSKESTTPLLTADYGEGTEWFHEPEE